MNTMMKTFAATGALLLLASCGKNESPKPPQPVVEYDAYISGYYETYQNKKIACYWLNGEWVDVTDGTKPTEFSSITASGGSLYIAGTEEVQPFYMKDGTRVYLKNRHYATFDIAVENGSVYVLGIGFYWKGSEEVVELFSSENFNRAALAVSDGRVYVAGEVDDQGIPYAACWKEDQSVSRLALPAQSQGSMADCATASGGSIYIGGRYFDKEWQQKPCYWKDGVLTPLEMPDEPGPCGVLAIAVENGKVYAAGKYSNEGCYWVDEKRMLLEVPDNARFISVTGIAVGSGKVYVAGTCERNTKDFPCCWIDGKCHELETAPDMRKITVTDIALLEKVAGGTSPATN